MSKRTLFLDDDEERHRQFAAVRIGCDVVHVRTVDECKRALLDLPPFEVVFLDHDLGGLQMVESVEGTGTEVAAFIRGELPDDKMPEHAIVHSLNPAGARRMAAIIRERGIWVTLIPFYLLIS